jgi:CRISPR-associated endonuclease Cas1
VPPARVNEPEASHQEGLLPMLDQNFTLPYPPLQVRAGVLVADGYGTSLRVLYGRLHVEDGIGMHRRSLVVDRAGSGLERLVLLGKTGSLTLEALAWLRAIGAALVHLGADGALLTHSVPFGYDGHPIRRAQALAATTGLDVSLACYLIAEKLDGQRANLARLRVSDLRAFDRLREALKHAATTEDVRICEAQAAAIYWNAWRAVPLRLRGRDLARMPARWARYDSRASVLTGAPRAATNPVNALLNYLYALLESEARLALLAVGLDPTLGVLHADQRNRDSFALDSMEPIRPAVDAFVLDLLEERILTSRDFAELSNGVCRVRAPLTHELALTLGRWRLLLAPIVAHLAQAFRAALLGRGDASAARPRAMQTMRKTRRESLASPRTATEMPEIPRTKGASASRIRLAVPFPSSAQSPLNATPRKVTSTRPYETKAWATPRPEAPPLIPAACARCGRPVEKRRRRHCEGCMPQARREHGLRAIERAREALRLQRLAGNDPRADAATNRKRSEAIVEQRRRSREWRRENPGATGHDRAWFLREVLPRLDPIPLRAIARATGLSLAACSRYRGGVRIPHPRHWKALATLVEEFL